MKKKLYIIYSLAGFTVMAFIIMFSLSQFSKNTGGDDYSTYIKASATVKTILPHKAISGKKRSFKIPAKVTFKTNEGKNIETEAMIMRIPYYGIIANEGDSVTVFYNPQKPELVRTYVDKYDIAGGYGILIITVILVGIYMIFSLIRLSRSKEE